MRISGAHRLPGGGRGAGASRRVRDVPEKGEGESCSGKEDCEQSSKAHGGGEEIREEGELETIPTLIPRGFSGEGSPSE